MRGGGGGSTVKIARSREIRRSMAAYHMYTRADDLCQSNGYFSLYLRKGAVAKIEELLQLEAGARVGWVGCGDGRELISVALWHPNVAFDGYEVNPHAMAIARRVARQAGIDNVVFHEADFETAPLSQPFSHVYSTAISGPSLYARLHDATDGVLCVLRTMWSRDWKKTDLRVATVHIAGSGEQRQLLCARVK